MINDQTWQCSINTDASPIFTIILVFRIEILWSFEVRIVVFCMQPFYNEVEKKVAAGSFGGDSPLDRSPVTADQLVNFDSECFLCVILHIYIYMYICIYVYIYIYIHQKI